GHRRPRPRLPRTQPRLLLLGARHRLPGLPVWAALPRPPLHRGPGAAAVRGMAPGRPDPGHPRPRYAADHRGVLAVLPHRPRRGAGTQRRGTGVALPPASAAGARPRAAPASAAAPADLALARSVLRPAAPFP